jgi:hypothetical protein
MICLGMFECLNNQHISTHVRMLVKLPYVVIISILRIPNIPVGVVRILRVGVLTVVGEQAAEGPAGGRPPTLHA